MMKNLTEGSPGKLIFKFVLPMLIGNVFQQGSLLIDRMFVGHYVGKTALAATGAAMPVIFLLIALIIGITIGGTIVTSQYFGAQDKEQLKKTVDTMLIFLFFASLFISCIGIIFSEKIFLLMNLKPDVVPQATLFMRIYFSGMILMFGLQGVSGLLRGMGDSKTPLYFLMIASISTIILDIILIVILRVGIKGAAISEITGSGIAFFIAVWYLNKNHEIIKISFKHLIFDKDIFIKIVKIGLPMGLQQSFVGLGMAFLVGIVNRFGTSSVAAYSAASQIDSFAALPAMNFSMALATYVGQNIGANKLHRVKQGLFATWLMTSSVSVFFSIVAWFFGKDLMHIFTSDPEVIRIGANYLVIVCSFYILFSTMFTFAGVFRGAGDTLIPMFITLFSLWVIRIPVSYFVSFKLGINGVWWGIPIAWFCGFMFSILYYLKGNWKNKSIVKKKVEIIDLSEN